MEPGEKANKWYYFISKSLLAKIQYLLIKNNQKKKLHLSVFPEKKNPASITL